MKTNVFLVISCVILLRMINSSNKYVHKIKHAFYFQYFFPEKCVLYGVICKKRQSQSRHSNNILRCMHSACWITKAIDTLRICNTYHISTFTTAKGTRPNVSLYTHSLSCNSLQSLITT